MSVSVGLSSKLDTQETLAANVPAVTTGSVVQHTGYSHTRSLSASTTPAATKAAYFLQALTAGAATIDLTALTGTNGASVTFSGLKVQAAKFRAPSTNANDIVITPGASNGYNLFGSAGSITLKPGQSVLLDLAGAAGAVGGSAKTLDLAGTGTQGLEISLVAG